MWRFVMHNNINYYTPDSPILGTPQATFEQAKTYCLAHCVRECQYTAYDVGSGIVPCYWSQCLAVGEDPVILLSQMIHETGGLSSWWSQRPRRNPAGIGVTGRNRSEPPTSGAWADLGGGVWAEGVSFGSWAEESIPAHAGRLLAYALAEGAGTPAQQQLIAKALAYRDLPDRYRGAAPTLRGLQGTWAVPGRLYATKLATIANAMCAVQV